MAPTMPPMAEAVVLTHPIAGTRKVTATKAAALVQQGWTVERRPAPIDLTKPNPATPTSED